MKYEPSPCHDCYETDCEGCTKLADGKVPIKNENRIRPNRYEAGYKEHVEPPVGMHGRAVWPTRENAEPRAKSPPSKIKASVLVCRLCKSRDIACNNCHKHPTECECAGSTTHLVCNNCNNLTPGSGNCVRDAILGLKKGRLVHSSKTFEVRTVCPHCKTSIDEEVTIIDKVGINKTRIHIVEGGQLQHHIENDCAAIRRKKYVAEMGYEVVKTCDTCRNINRRSNGSLGCLLVDDESFDVSLDGKCDKWVDKDEPLPAVLATQEELDEMGECGCDSEDGLCDCEDGYSPCNDCTDPDCDCHSKSNDWGEVGSVKKW